MIYLFLLLLGIFSCFLKRDNALTVVNNFVLGFSLVSYVLSESLSFLGVFTILVLRMISLAGLLLLLYYIWVHKENIKPLFNRIIKKPTTPHLLIFLLILGIGASAILYPPNNWDSNTYHLPRIIIWLQNKNIYHYPTHIFRQIYQPILSEVQLTWIYATYGPINLLNLQQFFYLIFSMIIGYLILQKLNDNNKITFSDVAIAVLSVSSAVLEASNTKNDILVTYFILNYIYCWVLLIKEGKVNVFLFVASIALSILTKGTSYIFLTAITIGFLLLLVIKIKLFKRLVRKKNIAKIFLSLFIVLFLLSPFFYRNISLSGNIYCQDRKEKIFYQNELITPKTVISNSIKNLSIQFCPPFNVIPVYNMVQKTHRFLNLPSVDDPALNFGGFKYATPEMKIKNYFEEDNVPNFYLFLFLVLFLSQPFFILKNRISIIGLVAHLFFYLFLCFFPHCLNGRFGTQDY